MHCRLDFVGREIHSLSAMRFAEFTSDINARLEAMDNMAYAYINRPLPEPNLAIPIFLDALKLSNGRVWIPENSIHEYVGLAHAYALNKDEENALIALKQGEQILSRLSTDASRDEFYLWEGKAFIELAAHSQPDYYFQKAHDAFSVLHGKGTAKAMCGAAIVQADAMCGLAISTNLLNI